MTTKKCTKCNVEKKLTEFNKNKAAKDGLAYKCRECAHIENHIWHKNPENRARRKKAWVKNSTEYIKNNPQRKAAANIRSRNKYIIKHIETVSDEVVKDALDIDRKGFKVHIEKQFKPGMTWQNHGAWHQEHDKPLSKFDLLDPEQVKIANHYTNIKPVWALHNFQKYNK
jgi:hypothetical protein